MVTQTQSEPVGVGFIGSGSVLWAYLQQLDRLVARGLAREGPICVRRAEVRQGLHHRRPAAHLVSDPQAVLGADIDVVVVITPPASHVELASLALEHSKHVLVEKPIGRTRAEAEEIVSLAKKQDRWLMAAPFVQLAPSVRALWTTLRDNRIGSVHSARAMYGNRGSTWARWYHDSGVGPLAEVGIYNLKTLTSLLGPVREVIAADATAVVPRIVAGGQIAEPDPDVMHLIARHASGALSSVLASQAVQHYRRPAVELYGTEGTANLLGDDWAPQGLEVWENMRGSWEFLEPADQTWLWTDGMRELVVALRDRRPPLQDLNQDLHLLDVVQSAHASARSGTAVRVESDFADLDLQLERPTSSHYVHDRTRPAEEQL